eukprot:gene32940-42627_t
MRNRNYQGHVEEEDYAEAEDGNLDDDTTGADTRTASNPEEEEVDSTENQTWPQEVALEPRKRRTRGTTPTPQRKDIETRPYREEPCYGDPAKRYVYISRSTLGPFKGAYAKKPLHQGQIIAKYTGNYDSDAAYTHYVYYNEATGMARDAWDHTKGEVTCLAGYINDPLMKEGGNCKFVEKGCHLAVETMQGIDEDGPGTEDDGTAGGNQRLGTTQAARQDDITEIARRWQGAGTGLKRPRDQRNCNKRPRKQQCTTRNNVQRHRLGTLAVMALPETNTTASKRKLEESQEGGEETAASLSGGVENTDDRQQTKRPAPDRTPWTRSATGKPELQTATQQSTSDRSAEDDDVMDEEDDTMMYAEGSQSLTRSQRKQQQRNLRDKTILPAGTILADGTVTAAALTKVQAKRIVANNKVNASRRAAGLAEIAYRPVVKLATVKMEHHRKETTATLHKEEVDRAVESLQSTMQVEEEQQPGESAGVAINAFSDLRNSATSTTLQGKNKRTRY